MRLLKTGVFEQDIKRLDKPTRERLRKAIEKIAANPELGKPLEHAPGICSERIGNFRLAYRAANNEILLICFKNRDEIYEYLKRLLAG